MMTHKATNMKQLIIACVAILIFSSNLQSQTDKTPNCPNVELQELTIVFMRLEPRSKSLTVNMHGVNEYQLKDSEIELLKSAGLKGLLDFNGGGIFGNIVGCKANKQSRVIMIGRTPIKRPIALAQPDGVDVIYYQDGSNWKMIPSNAPLLKRNIILEPSKINKRVTDFWVEHILGSRQGGSAFNW
jgi:hypothetical protein